MYAGRSELGKNPRRATGSREASAEVHRKPTAKAVVMLGGHEEMCAGNTSSLLQG